MPFSLLRLRTVATPILLEDGLEIVPVTRVEYGQWNDRSDRQWPMFDEGYVSNDTVGFRRLPY
ncbi:hypothetical protein C488_03600 [Natrinema pellirubrum DSM 15624]|uniref:Uncharacterized protein n=1 Tax=Natrinema pellirubrum (strain DSM 15624 / CIP 106293 / JCM 10476 / NCIMB 786 / 157) TaxID=797303 RepID=L9Z578_NATP1|nr:hypothetical protein C488_03600 [Natrinema pellirubrum DSM 15624]